jgi:hypothetical protein
MRVSKEVQALRDFESTLLKGYQAYLKTLLAAASAKPSPGSSARLATARVAVRCMGQLLVAKPGFNYSSDLLQVGLSSGLLSQGLATLMAAQVFCNGGLRADKLLAVDLAVCCVAGCNALFGLSHHDPMQQDHHSRG